MKDNCLGGPKYCPECGKELESYASQCKFCGKSLEIKKKLEK